MRIALVLSVLALIGVCLTASSRRSRRLTATPPVESAPGALAGWNVLLVSLDTVRADHLGCYGYAAGSTPNFDTLAAGGVLCRQAVAPAPLTLPSHATLLTGLDPHHHGARSNGVFRVRQDAGTLAERLKASGYRTGAVISAYVLDRQYGLNRGFDDYLDDLTEGSQPSRFGFRERRADQTNVAASRWLREHKAERFFLWVHYFDPHAPYDPPEPYRTRFAGRSYDGEIAFIDEQFGRLLGVLDEIGVRRRTLIVVVADHGESLGEHRELTHGIMIYDATVRVPMIWNAPGVLPSRFVVGAQVGLVDVAPTILDLLGLTIPSGTDGVSLVRPYVESRRVYIESLGPMFQYGWSPLVGLRSDAHKFIWAPSPELYDLVADPNELDNRIAQRRGQAEEMLASIRSRLGGDPALVRAVSSNLPMDDASRRKLEGLGYVFRTGTTQATQPALPDPKDMMDDWMLLQQAETLANRGEYARAIALLEPHLQARPGDLRSWEVLSECYQSLGQLDRALAAYRREVELAHRKVEAHVGVGSILMEMGKVAEAEAAFQQALTEDPQSSRALFGLGTVRLRQNRADEAMRLFEQAVELGRGSNTSMCWFNIGAIHHGAGRIEQARAAFEQSLKVDPANPRSARALAELLRQAGQEQQAIALLKSVVDQRPDAEACAALGQMYVQGGQVEPARKAFQKAIELRSDLPTAHLYLGVLEAGAGNAAEAERHLKRAIELAPGWAEAHFNWGVLLAINKRLPEAAEAFRKAVELQPNHAAAHNALGQALLTLNRTEAAEGHFRKALQIDPNLTAARENLNRCTTKPR